MSGPTALPKVVGTTMLAGMCQRPLRESMRLHQGETIECLKFNLLPVRQLVILARNREQRFKAANRDVNIFSSSPPYQPDHTGNTAPGSGHQPGI